MTRRIEEALDHLGMDVVALDPNTSEIDNGDYSYVTAVWRQGDTEYISVVYVSQYEPHPNVIMTKEVAA
jgi:hypothetical protein